MKYAARTAWLIAGALAVCGAKAPPAPPQTLVGTILKDLGEDARGATAAQVRRGLKPVDVDGDGHTDYLFSKEALGPGWCGSGGCWMELWRATPGGFAKIFDGQAREVRFRTGRDGRGKVMDLDLHGSACHTFGAHVCPASFRWDAALGRLVEAPAPDGTGWIRFLRPTEAHDRTPPAGVTAAYDEAVRRCKAAGGGESEPERPMTVPDVDGDGRRDWIIPESWCGSAAAGGNADWQVILFASAGNPAAPVVAARAPRLDIDAASRPATVWAVTCPPDDYDSRACKRHRLVWTPAARRLSPRD